MTEKKQILARAKDLRTSEHDTYGKVYIRPDLTKNQLEASKNLRRQLQEQRQAHPTKKWIIKQNEIIEVLNA